MIMAIDYAVPTDTPARLLTERRTFPRIAAAPLAWRHAALGAVLLVAAALNLWGLDREGYANTYYAAAIKSMLTSWHNFFYLSFDSGGFVSVDKAPLGLWVQAASAKVFGFSGLSLLVPEALAGVLSVAVLYYLVARVFGAGAGLVAALALALTPVSVVTSRNNTIDSLLVLTLLLGAWAASRAAETGRLRLLLLGALVVGLVVAAARARRRLPLDRRGQALVLWAGWLLAAGAFFSFARFFPFYYLIMLGPPVAALAGIGLRALWQDYRETLGRRAALWRGWLLPLTLIATAAAQLYFVAPYADQYGWLPPLVAGGCLFAVAVLAAARLRLAVLLAPGVLLQAGWRTAVAAMAVGPLALLAAPPAWAMVSVANNNGAAWLPQAGPDTSPFGPGGRGGFGGQRGRPSFGAGPA